MENVQKAKCSQEGTYVNLKDSKYFGFEKLWSTYKIEHYLPSLKNHRTTAGKKLLRKRVIRSHDIIHQANIDSRKCAQTLTNQRALIYNRRKLPRTDTVHALHSR